MSALWTLGEGLELVRKLEAELRAANWHCALTGSVLHRGQSDKDLDIIVYPRKKTSSQRPNMRGMHAALKRAGLTPWMSRKKLVAKWRKRGIKDNKWVEIWVASGVGRVDIMVLS